MPAQMWYSVSMRRAGVEIRTMVRQSSRHMQRMLFVELGQHRKTHLNWLYHAHTCYPPSYYDKVLSEWTDFGSIFTNPCKFVWSKCWTPGAIEYVAPCMQKWPKYCMQCTVQWLQYYLILNDICSAIGCSHQSSSFRWPNRICRVWNWMKVIALSRGSSCESVADDELQHHDNGHSHQALHSVFTLTESIVSSFCM